MSLNTDLRELTEFVREVRERKDREASVQKAIAQARKRATLREQFRPITPRATGPIKLGF